MATPDDSDRSRGAADQARTSRGLQSSVRRLLVLVACCGAMLWAWRHFREDRDPSVGEIRKAQERAIKVLSSGNSSQRLAAANDLERLRTMDDAMVLAPLSKALDDPDPAVRGVAARALGGLIYSVLRSGDDSGQVRAAVASLIRATSDREAGVRMASLTSLGTLGISHLTATSASSPFDHKAAFQALVARLEDPDAEVRRAAIRALTHTTNGIPQEVAPPEELTAALRDPAAMNRVEAIVGLANFATGRDPWFTRVLRLAEQEPEPTVRVACLEFLDRSTGITPAVVPALIAALRSPLPDVCSAAARSLGRFGTASTPAIPELLRLLKRPIGSEPVASRKSGATAETDPGRAAAHSLGSIAPGTPDADRVVAALAETARSGPPSRRAPAVLALGDFLPAEPGTIGMLIEILKDPDLARRARASLGGSRTADGLPFESPDVELLGWAARSLGRLAPGTPQAGEAVAALLPLLDSEITTARDFAVDALGRFGTEAAAAVPKLRRLSDDRDPAVKGEATRAIRRIEILDQAIDK